MRRNDLQDEEWGSLARKHLLPLLEESLTGVYLVRKNKIIYVNARVEEMFGYKREELLHMDPLELVHPEDRGLLGNETDNRLRGQKERAPYWVRGLRKDRSVFYYETQGSLIHYRGSPALIGTLLDVSSKVRADELLRENDLRYQRLIKYLPEPIFVHDGEEIIYVNNAALKLLGAKHPDQLNQMCSSTLIHQDYQLLARQRVRQVLMSDDPVDFQEMKMIRLDGQVIEVEASSIRIHQFLGRKMVVQTVFRDITQRKRSEEALIRSEKLSIAGQMAAGIAHEIRNPLTSLKGFSQFLKSKVQGYDQYFDIMLTELDRINNIVQEFMALAKPQVNQFEHVDLIGIVDSVVTLVEPQAIIQNVQITTETASRAIPVWCDRNQLKQVFINLLRNAVEAMPDGGSVTIKLGYSEPDYVIVTISDEGIGIEEEQLERLGDPFFTTKEGGTGLGLMICHRIVQAHEGAIHYDSKPGAGTTVTMELRTGEK